MPKNLIKVISLLSITAFAFVSVFGYLYDKVLPYTLVNQWQPTPESLNITGEYDPNDEVGEYLGTTVFSENITTTPPENKKTKILGESEDKFKHIEVDLTNQKVYAYEGTTKVMEFLVSTGKWGRTPTGHFMIEYKTLAQKMSGGSRALGTYYYLPNVQFVQFFGNDEIPWGRGFSFHGTYWHENFGTPQSHGCINMRNEDAEQLFYWTTPTMGDSRIVRSTKENSGTPVFIYGTTPDS